MIVYSCCYIYLCRKMVKIPYICPVLKGGKCNCHCAFHEIHRIPPLIIIRVGITGCFCNKSCWFTICQLLQWRNNKKTDWTMKHLLHDNVGHCYIADHLHIKRPLESPWGQHYLVKHDMELLSYCYWLLSYHLGAHHSQQEMGEDGNKQREECVDG